MTKTITDAVATRDAAPTPREVLRTLLDRNAQAVGASLPSGYSTDRFIRLLLTAANTNPELFECDPRSFLAAGVACAQLGLEPNDARGLAYLVPFNDRKRGIKQVTMILGYKGMLDLARRSGLVTAINAFPVFAEDDFEFAFGLHPTLKHVPSPDGDDDPAHLTYVYAVASIAGDKQFTVLSRRQVDRVKLQYARSASSPWHTHYVEMALKTALRRLCKWLPQTVEMATAVETEDRGLVLGELAMPGAIYDDAYVGHSLEPGDPDDEAIEAQVSGDGAADDQPAVPPESDTAVSPQPGGRRRAGPSTQASPPAATEAEAS
jgi:recombination protein RecT